MNLQATAHDWKTPGTIVWTKEQGHLCPPLENPKKGEVIIFVDYEKDNEESLIQIDVELAIDALGYPCGPRYMGDDPRNENANIVSYVGTFPSSETNFHLEVLKAIAPLDVLSVIEG
jgi:hypothetical protein